MRPRKSESRKKVRKPAEPLRVSQSCEITSSFTPEEFSKADSFFRSWERPSRNVEPKLIISLRVSVAPLIGEQKELICCATKQTSAYFSTLFAFITSVLGHQAGLFCKMDSLPRRTLEKPGHMANRRPATAFLGLD